MKKERRGKNDSGKPSMAALEKRREFPLVEFMVGKGVMTLLPAGCFSGLGQAMILIKKVKSNNFEAQFLQPEPSIIHDREYVTYYTKDGLYDYS